MDVEIKPFIYPIIGYTDWKNKINELIEEAKANSRGLDELPGRPSLISRHGDKTAAAAIRTHKIIFELVIYAWSIRFYEFINFDWQPRIDLNKPEEERDEETKKDLARIRQMRSDAINILSKLRMLRLFYVKHWLYIDNRNRGGELDAEYVKKISALRAELAQYIDDDSIGGQALRGIPAALCIEKLAQCVH
jgi:hypothetical protein